MFKTFVPFQFIDYPLVWMCHSWTFNRISNIHHRTLRIAYLEKKTSFEKLLRKDKSVSPYKNLQYLATKIYREVKNGGFPIIINEVFNFQENERENLRSGIHLASRNMHTVHFITDTISSSGHKLWKLISDKQKHASTLSAFKAKNKSCTICNCLYRLCKKFVKDLGFVKVYPSL